MLPDLLVCPPRAIDTPPKQLATICATFRTTAQLWNFGWIVKITAVKAVEMTIQ
jgi:hypothetical protein